MKISLLTLGCKVNQSETLLWEQELQEKGHEIVSLEDAPDLCVINTCTVTSNSDIDSRRLIRKAESAGAKVLVTGCYAELNYEVVSRMTGVVQVVGNRDKDCIIDTVESPDKIIVHNKRNEALKGAVRSRARKFLKIQDGCNYSCTYCVVWKARGISRSIRPEEIIRQARRAADDGFKEIVLTGVHIGLFGKDLHPQIKLASLIDQLVKEVPSIRIRLSSLEVNEINNEIITHINEGNVCRHLHIPLQSGDNNVLRMMNRNYTREYFKDKVFEIKEALGDLSIGTDIIVGFPSEDDKAFENTLGLVNELPLTYCHVFPYSPRPRSSAAEMIDIVGPVKRKKRALRLRKLSNDKKDAYARKQIGKKLPVLIEGCLENGICHGTSDNYLKIDALAPCDKIGQIVQIRITEININRLLGDIV